MTKNSDINPLKRSKDKLKLDKYDVHLWFIKPQDYLGKDNLLSSYSSLLSANELIKQQRYKFENDRHDALVTRAFIRDLLTYYADVLPQDLQFEKGDKGKPELINFPLPLRFNLSHTKNLIVCAVTLEDDIGCDVEDTGRNNNVLAIANRYFSTIETNELFNLPKAQQQDRFFDYWTLKEAYIKAWGLGLAIPLADFSFHLGDDSAVPHGIFSIKPNIKLSFAKHRQDKSEVWRNWLIYPSTSIDGKNSSVTANENPDKASIHRIAISLRSKQNNQKTDYRLRFFDSSPLQGYEEF